MTLKLGTKSSGDSLHLGTTFKAQIFPLNQAPLIGALDDV